MTKDIVYVGVNDEEIDLFEGQYAVPNGMAYNSYLILDENVAVMDTVDARFVNVWLQNIRDALGESVPRYLVVQHVEPDHSAGICAFLAAYPDAVVVASSRAFAMLDQFYGTDVITHRLAVGEGDKLTLGKHELTFFAAPMVHWPEVIVTYDATDRVLFSADAFGKFGTLDTEEDWACEARRYYFGIVGKYGAQVTALLKKVSSLELAAICPLHGPTLSGDLSYYIGLYRTWASYQPEEEGVMIAYTSVYGNTRRAVMHLAELLRAAGCPKVVLNDLARCDMAEAVEDAFRYSKLVLATTTYNADVFPFMREFISHLTERNFSNRTVAMIENGSWAPAAARVMRGMLEPCKNLTFTDTTVLMLSALNAESEAALEALARELLGA